MRVLLEVVVLISLSSNVAVCLLCDGDKDCFGGYPSCCAGYCKQSCNLTCTLSSDCGSLGHLQEKCCNRNCVHINSVCPQVNSKGSRLTSTHIAVLVLCILVFIMVGTCALVMYVCKCGYFHRRRRNPDYIQGPAVSNEHTWSQAFIRCVRCKVSRNEELLNANTIVCTTETWVGKDFILANPAYSNRSTQIYMNQ